MAEAFKCDICGEYRDGKASIISFKPTSYFSGDSVNHDICGECKIKIIETFSTIAKLHDFVNDYNCDENRIEYDIKVDDAMAI